MRREGCVQSGKEIICWGRGGEATDGKGTILERF